MGINFPIFNGRTIITLDQFLTNPSGKGSSMFGKREEIKKNLNERYYKILKNSTKDGNFNYKMYIDKNSYLFYFKIPSETFQEIDYDVVLEFVPTDKKQEKFSTINDYSINFFSNSPHMMFTYTYVLGQEKLLIRNLESSIKYSKKALKDKPRVTNPVEIFGFEKSCYYACKYINEKKLYTKKDIEKDAIVLGATNRLDFINSIMSQESKYIQYETIKKKYADLKKKERQEKAKKANTEYEKAVKAKNDKKSPNSKTINKKKTSGFKSVFSKKKK